MLNDQSRCACGVRRRQYPVEPHASSPKRHSSTWGFCPSAGMTMGPPRCSGADGGRTPGGAGCGMRCAAPGAGRVPRPAPGPSAPGLAGGGGKDRTDGPGGPSWRPGARGGRPGTQGKGRGAVGQTSVGGGGGCPWGRRPPKVGPVRTARTRRVGRSATREGTGDAPGPNANRPLGGGVRRTSAAQPTGRLPLRAYPNNPLASAGGGGRRRRRAASTTQRWVACFALLACGCLARPRADEGVLG